MRFSLALFSQKAKPEAPASVIDFWTWLFQPKDLTLRNLLNQKYIDKMKSIEFINKYLEDEILRLGPELNAAHFVLRLGGKCRVHGSSEWLLAKNESDLKRVLPQNRVNNFFLEGLDLSRTIIQYGGLHNIEECSRLETLVIKEPHFVDDWCMWRLAQSSFADTLVNLELENCPLVTDKGILALGHLKNLRKLDLKEMHTVKSKEFIALLLEEQRDGELEVTGCDHLSEETLLKVEQTLDNELTQLNMNSMNGKTSTS